MKGSITYIPWFGQLFLLAGIYLIGEVVFSQLAVVFIGLLYPEMDVYGFVTGLATIKSAGDVSATGRAVLILYQTFTTIGRFILVAALFQYLKNEPFLSGLRLNKRITIQIAVTIFFIMFSVVSISNYISDWNQHLRLPTSLHNLETSMRQMEETAKVMTEIFLSTNTFGGLLINILVIGALAAIAEEIFFRGVVQGLIYKGTGNGHLAVWIAAFFFSFIHFQFFGFFPRLLLGALIGYLYLWSGSLWSSIIAHFINNSMSVIAWFCVEKGWMGKDVAESPNLIAAIISLPFVILLLIAFRKIALQHKEKDGKELDDGVFNKG